MSNKLVEYNKKKVLIRKEKIEEACNCLLEQGKQLTYKNISEITNIPYRTLESPNYRDYIKNFKKRKIVTKEKEEMMYILMK